MSDETRKIIEDIRESRDRANEIVEKALQRKADLLAGTHKSAKAQISSLSQQNSKKLNEIKAELDKENKKKEAESIKTTNERIQRQEQNGEAHLDELVDLLYNTVLNVETE